MNATPAQIAIRHLRSNRSFTVRRKKRRIETFTQQVPIRNRNSESHAVYIIESARRRGRELSSSLTRAKSGSFDGSTSYICLSMSPALETYIAMLAKAMYMIQAGTSRAYSPVRSYWRSGKGLPLTSSRPRLRLVARSVRRRMTSSEVKDIQTIAKVGSHSRRTIGFWCSWESMLVIAYSWPRYIM